MEKNSRLLIVTTILSTLLPYGLISYSSGFSTTVQEWLFPFWYYVNDLDWPGPGVIRIIFTDPWYPFPLILLGLLWAVLGLASSKLLHDFYLDQIPRNLIILLLLGALTSQIVMTFPVMLYLLDFTPPYAIPLPFHTLLILVLTIFVSKRSADQ